MKFNIIIWTDWMQTEAVYYAKHLFIMPIITRKGFSKYFRHRFTVLLNTVQYLRIFYHQFWYFHPFKYNFETTTLTCWSYIPKTFHNYYKFNYNLITKKLIFLVPCYIFVQSTQTICINVCFCEFKHLKKYINNFSIFT